MAIDLAASAARPLPRERSDASAPLLLHVLPSFAVGGVQVRLARVIGALGHRYRHRIIAIDGNRSAGRLIDPALDVTIDTTPPVRHGLPSALFAIRRELHDAAPDLLLTY